MDFIFRVLLGLVIVQTVFTQETFAKANLPIKAPIKGMNCIAKEEINEIAAHFTQFKNLAGKEFCFDESETSNLILAIVFMRKTAFDKNMPKSNDELFSGTFASNWWNYFIGRIDEFNVQSSCPNGVGAYVMPFFGGKTMYVCPLMLSKSFASLDRASVFMHEARHIDGFPHMTCTKGPRKGIQGACDNKISDHGSYGVTVETYAQLAKYATDLHPALKAYSKASAIVYGQEAFETPTKMDRKSEFVFLTMDKQFHKLNVESGVKVSALGHSPSLGNIVMRAEFMVLFPEDKNLSASYVFAHDEGIPEQSPGPDVIEYNSQTPADKMNLIALHYGAQFKAKVYANKVSMACDPTTPSLKDVAITGTAKPMTFVYPYGYSREPKVAHLQMENGQIMEVGCQGTNPYITNSSIKYDKIFKRVYLSGTATLGLGTDGNLYTITNGVSTLLNTGFQGKVFELAPSASYSFFDSMN